MSIYRSIIEAATKSNIIGLIFKSPILFGVSYEDTFDHGLIDPDQEMIDQVNDYLNDNLAKYMDEDKSVTKKVQSIFMHCTAYEIVTKVELLDKITTEEYSDLKDFIEGQLSDGIGEGLEQQPIGDADVEVDAGYEDEDGEYHDDYVTERGEVSCMPWWPGKEYGAEWYLESDASKVIKHDSTTNEASTSKNTNIDIINRLLSQGVIKLVGLNDFKTGDVKSIDILGNYLLLINSEDKDSYARYGVVIPRTKANTQLVAEYVDGVPDYVNDKVLQSLLIELDGLGIDTTKLSK